MAIRFISQNKAINGALEKKADRRPSGEGQLQRMLLNQIVATGPPEGWQELADS